MSWMNTIRSGMVSLLVCALGVCAVGGCTSVRTINPATAPTGAAFEHIDTGDTIAILLGDGRSLKIVVEWVEADAIVSQEGVRYAKSDIRQLQRRSFSGWKTGVLIGGIVFGAYVAAGLAVVSAYDASF